MRPRSVIIVGIIALVFILPSVIALDGAKGERGRQGETLNLSLNTSSIELDARTPSSVYVQGNVSYWGNDTQTQVTLSAIDYTGMTIDIVPNTFTMTSNETLEFRDVNVSILADQGSEATTQTIKITASWNGGSSSQNLFITVNPYYGVSMQAVDGKGPVVVGSSSIYSVKVENTGNVVDDFSLSVVNDDLLVSEGWLIQFSNREISLAPGEEEVVDVTVTPPDDFITSSYSEEIGIEVKSKGDNSLTGTSAETSIEVSVEPDNSSVGVLAFIVVLVVVLIVYIAYLQRKKKME